METDTNSITDLSPQEFRKMIGSEVRKAVAEASGKVGREWLSPAEVAIKVGRHPETIRRWLRQGKLAFRQEVVGGRMQIHVDEVNRWMRDAEDRAPAA